MAGPIDGKKSEHPFLVPKRYSPFQRTGYVQESAVTGNSAPLTIHDFGGFPEPLYRVNYPAPGKPELARRVQELLAPLPVVIDQNRGLDHGIWSVLRHLYPDADIPVVQLSIDKTKESACHYETGRRIAALRREGVLILGSGNIVHNLHTFLWGRHEAVPYEWAVRFDETVRKLLLAGDDEKLINYEKLGEDALLAVPTPDHYLPLLYVIGTRMKGEAVSFPVEGIDGGSVAMLAVQIG